MPAITKIDIKPLLKSTATLIKHHKQLTKIKGENFNVFSILGMESLENKTHSAFLGELLNPSGSHLMGDVFLKLFLEVVKHEENSFITAKAKLVLEKYVGARNDELKEGGRIDIYLKDNEGRTLSIENKIYAVDQYAQLERYVKHNEAKNTVYYLSLHGEDASEESRGDLEAGKDYINVSYKEHIISWLERCVKEAAEHPILRETIKQYAILIKKLTNTMSTELNQKLTTEILQNYEAAQIIADNFYGVREEIGDRVRLKLFEKLKAVSNYKVELGSNRSRTYSQIWMTPIMEGLNLDDRATSYLGMESFNGKGHYNGQLFIGVILEKRNGGEAFKHDFHSWHDIKKLEPFEELELSFNNPKLLKKINTDKEFEKSLVSHLVDLAKSYMTTKYDKIAKALREK